MTTAMDYSWDESSAHIECADTVSPTEGDWHRLMGLVQNLYNKTPLSELNVHKVVGSIPPQYHYGFTTKDGREWSQHLVVNAQHPQTNTTMNFSVTDFFSLDEFIPHRPLRDEIIRLIAQRQIEKIEIRWT